MEKNSVIDLINKELRSYGTNEYGDPMFRAVFSDDQIEKRQVLMQSTVFGRYVDIREVQKYPWIKRKWIMERWAPGEISYHPDLVTDKNGVYVCIYVFQDANQNYLPPLLKVAQIIMNNLLNPRGRGKAEAEDKLVEEKKTKEEIDAIETELRIGSDEAATKDPKSSRETASVGYTKGENDG